jgi:hypothetical protein
MGNVTKMGVTVLTLPMGLLVSAFPVVLVVSLDAPVIASVDPPALAIRTGVKGFPLREVSWATALLETSMGAIVQVCATIMTAPATLMGAMALMASVLTEIFVDALVGIRVGT